MITRDSLAMARSRLLSMHYGSGVEVKRHPRLIRAAMIRAGRPAELLADGKAF